MKANEMNGDLATAISRKLNVLIALSIKQILGDTTLEGSGKRRMRVAGTVRYLDDLGLDAKDIAQIVGSPLGSVRTLLTPARRK
jgi:hypothetical protein